MNNAFPARYRGKCSDCGEWWQEGDPIRFVTYAAGDDGWTPADIAAGNFVHDDCDAAGPTEKPEGKVCPRCFLRKSLSGDCGCDA